MNTDGTVGAEPKEDGAVRRWGRMRKVLLLLGVWGVVFALLSVYGRDGGGCGEPGEWIVCIGYPRWFYSSGYDNNYPGFWRGLMGGEWGVLYLNLLSAMAVAFAPLVVPILGYLLVKRRLRFHLATAVVLTLVAGVLLWANNVHDVNRLRRGWPLSRSGWGALYLSDVVVTDVSVAVTVLFFTALAVEWWVNRKHTKAGGDRLR